MKLAKYNDGPLVWLPASRTQKKREHGAKKRGLLTHGMLGLFFCSCLGIEGCSPFLSSSPRDSGRLSLIEIGEQAIEKAEKLEAESRDQDALEAYERAVWAFEYHLQLTGTPPLFFEEARQGRDRLRAKVEASQPPSVP